MSEAATEREPAAVADGRAGGARRGAAPLLEVDQLRVRFAVRRGAVRDRPVGHVHAVDGVSLRLWEGETLGVVGESGCGKTTLLRAIVRLLEPDGGTIRFRGRDITRARRRALAPVRRELQLVFQDPLAALNPRKRVGQIIGAAVAVRGHAGRASDELVGELLARVGLAPGHADRFPHELSGGQRQRVGIARALAAEPRLILLDEPFSALDVSTQAQIVNLLADLRDALGLSYVLVAHDLAVVRQLADRIAVMYLGKIVESGPAEALSARPIHPYTAGLLDAIPVPDPRRRRAHRPLAVRGEPPSPLAPPSGCRFRTRCPRATARCAAVEPALVEHRTGHLAACHHPLNVTAAARAQARRSPPSPSSAGDAAAGPVPEA